MGHAKWTPEFEPARRQRGGGRGRGRPGHGGRGGWGGPMSGPPPWLAQMFGPGAGGDLPGGRGGGRGRAQVRRGDVRSAILDVLHTAEGPLNGYQLIQQIAERTEGVWKPSPGSVYPTMAQLLDEGLLEDAPAGRKAVQLTTTGSSYVQEHTQEMAAVWAPFAEQPDDEEAVDFKQVLGQTFEAVVQVAKTGTPDQREKAVEILGDTRRRLYGLLADGPETTRTAAPQDE